MIKTLNAKERRRFGEYVSSPFFNKHEVLRQLALYILGTAPAFAASRLGWERASKEILPKEKPDKLKWNNLISDLTELLKGFLSILHFEKNDFSMQLHLLGELRDKHLVKDYELNLKEATKMQEKFPYRDQMYFYNKYLTAEEYDSFFGKLEKHAQDESLQHKVDNLDLFYLATKLKNSCEMVNRGSVISVEYELHMLDNVMEYVSSRLSEFENYPAITIYYQILLTLREEENDENYPKLKKMLEAYADRFSPAEARELYEYARNYCIRKANTGEKAYLNELFEIYKLLLEKELIFKGKYISQWDYRNIVTVSLRLEEYDWTIEFINEYKERLAPEFRENAYLSNMATVHFRRKEYKEALKLLQTVEFTDVYYNIDSKSMLLKIYYELDREEALYYLIDSFSQYLRRNKLVSSFQKNAQLNRLKFVKKIFKVKQRNERGEKGISDRLQKITSEIETEKEVINKEWLIEKIMEIKTKN